jgi:hypothetical protein
MPVKRVAAIQKKATKEITTGTPRAKNRTRSFTGLAMEFTSLYDNVG